MTRNTKEFRAVAAPLARMSGVLAAVLLSACTSMSGLGGNSEFNCQAPAGIPCRSVSAVDHAVRTGQLSSEPAPVSRDRGDATGRVNAALSGTVPGAPRYHRASTELVDGEATLGAIRSDPTVIRIWIAPYEDNEGDLHEASRVYLQIDAGRWLIEHNQDRIKRSYAAQPVQPARLAEQQAQPSAQGPEAQHLDGQQLAQAAASGNASDAASAPGAVRPTPSVSLPLPKGVKPEPVTGAARARPAALSPFSIGEAVRTVPAARAPTAASAAASAPGSSATAKE